MWISFSTRLYCFTFTLINPWRREGGERKYLYEKTTEFKDRRRSGTWFKETMLTETSSSEATIFLSEYVDDCEVLGVCSELFYEKTFLQRAVVHIYFSDACLVCAEIYGAHRDAASYLSDALFTDYKTPCKMRCDISLRSFFPRSMQIAYVNPCKSTSLYRRRIWNN